MGRRSRIVSKNAPLAEPPVVVVVDDVVVIVVAVVAVVLVVSTTVVLGGQGGGAPQLPGPTSTPPAVAQSVGDSTMQVRKAPPGDVGRQHCVVGSIVVVVVAPHSSQPEVRALTVPPFATHCCADFAIRAFVLPWQSRKLVQDVAALFVHFPITVSQDPKWGRSHTTASSFARPQTERAAQSTNDSVQDDETSVETACETHDPYPLHRSAVQSCSAATVPGRTNHRTARLRGPMPWRMPRAEAA